MYLWNYDVTPTLLPTPTHPHALFTAPLILYPGKPLKQHAPQHTFALHFTNVPQTADEGSSGP